MKAYKEDPSPSASAPLTLRTSFVREAYVRYRGRGLKTPPIRGPAEAVALVRQIVHDEAREHFVVLYLDGRHRPIAQSVVSVGTATASLVHPREVYQTAVLSGAVAILILHNHPSGDPTPSTEDGRVATRLREAGSLLGIELLDSIVWVHESRRFISMRDESHPAFTPLP